MNTAFPLHFLTIATHMFILLDSLREIEVIVFKPPSWQPCSKYSAPAMMTTPKT